MAKKTKKDSKPKTPKNKTTEERLSETLESVSRARKMVKTLSRIANTIEFAMDI